VSLPHEEIVAARRATRYRLEYPPALPITAAREELLAAIAEHRVIVVCGDTGSGKTTQLPKLCLEAGRGIEGMIGHTQPRRIAAQAVASCDLRIRRGQRRSSRS
jgi:ATP-dependent helicase HrpA